jgi:hypothetical protein
MRRARTRCPIRLLAVIGPLLIAPLHTAMAASDRGTTTNNPKPCLNQRAVRRLPRDRGLRLRRAAANGRGWPSLSPSGEGEMSALREGDVAARAAWCPQAARDHRLRPGGRACACAPARRSFRWDLIRSSTTAARPARARRQTMLTDRGPPIRRSFLSWRGDESGLGWHLHRLLSAYQLASLCRSQPCLSLARL